MENKLEKKYGLFTAICMVVGIVVGSGVFFKAQVILQKTGGDMPLGVLAWLIGGAIMIVCILAFSAMAQKYEKVNGIVDYAEAIVGALSRAGLLVSRRGKTGGYVLSKSADAITAGDILRAGEGSLATVACLSAPVNPCPRAAGCKTLPFWRALDRHIAGFCDSVSLSALVTGEFLP